MIKKTSKLDNIEVNKKEFHLSKQTIALKLVNINQILISNKFEPNDKGFMMKDDAVVRYHHMYHIYIYIYLSYEICIILPQMSGYTKYFDNVGKNIFYD